MANIDIINEELNYIQDEYIRNFIAQYMENCTPKYFWEIGASSSGKYHPVFAQGDGGLVRHTKAVVRWCIELMNLNSYKYLSDEQKDYAIGACIMHDTRKYGSGDEMDKTAYENHPYLASVAIHEYWDEICEDCECPFILTNAVLTHMGQWGKEKPLTPIDRLVHMADYCASRSFIDMPDYHPTIDNEED